MSRHHTPAVHVHVVHTSTGLLITTARRRLEIARRGDQPGAQDVRDALEAELGPLATWPAGRGPGAVIEESAGQVWWFAGAWWGCVAAEVEDVRRLVRTHAPDADTADAWESSADPLGLQELPDHDLHLVCEALGELAPGELVRCSDGDLARHRHRPWPELDAITGAARRVLVRPQELGLPISFRHVHAVLPRTELGWPAWQADRLAPATAFGDEAVIERALASAVAHLAGPWSGTTAIRSASVPALEAAGEAYLAPGVLAVTDPDIVRHPASPLTPIDRDRPLAWVRGQEVRSGDPVWVPLRFVHTSADPPAVPDQPVSAYHNLVGMAAGRDLGDAIHSALMHVVSHDAVASWWRRADAQPLSALPTPESLQQWWGDSEVELDLRRVPSRFAATVVLAVVRDRGHAMVGLGHAAAGDGDELAAAMTEAALEALLKLVCARDLVREDSRIRAAGCRDVGAADLLAHRSMRDYLHVAPPSSQATGALPRPAAGDPMVHLQLGLDPLVREHLEGRLGPPRDVDPLAPRRYAARRGEDSAVWVETTPPALRGSGWTAVRVVHPGCLRLEPAAFPLCPPPDGTFEELPYPGW